MHTSRSKLVKGRNLFVRSPLKNFEESALQAEDDATEDKSQEDHIKQKRMEILQDDKERGPKKEKPYKELCPRQRNPLN